MEISETTDTEYPFVMSFLRNDPRVFYPSYHFTVHGLAAYWPMHGEIWNWIDEELGRQRIKVDVEHQIIWFRSLSEATHFKLRWS